MKCQKCNENFKIIGLDKEHIGICPKCGERIVPTPNAFESIPEAIYYCIMVGSKEPFDILNNKTKLNSYLEDTLGSSYPERNMVKAAVDSDVGSVLFKARKSTNSAQKEAFDEAVDMMHRSYGTELGIARKTVKYFTDAMGWNIITEQPKQSTSPSNQEVVSNTAARPAPVSPVNNANVRSQPPKQNVPAAPAMANNTQNSVQTPPPQQTNYNNGYTQQMTVEPKKKKKGCLGFFLILTLLFLAIIAFLIFKIFLSNDNDDDTSTKPESTISQSIDVDDTETDVTTENDDTTNEESATQTTSKEKTTTSKDDEEQPTSDNKAEETGKYTVRSLSDYIDYKNQNHNGKFEYNRFDIDNVENTLYYALSNSIYKINLSTGDSELYTQIAEYSEFSFADVYVLYNTYNQKLYCILAGYIPSRYGGEYSSYLFDISTNKPELIKEITHADDNKYAFTSENKICSLIKFGYTDYISCYEDNIIDQTEIEGCISDHWEYTYENLSGKQTFYNFGSSMMPLLKNDSYYWLESKSEDDDTTAVCYTMKSICNHSEDCKFIGLFKNAISQCVTENEAYIMTDDFSISRIDVEKLLENNSDGNPNFDCSNTLEIIIDGKDIKQTGLNSLSEPMGLKMTTDGRFVVFDKSDNTFKIVEKK